jgi:hypothetical protein
MAHRTPKLVVDRYSKVLWGLVQYTAAVLALVGVVAFWFDRMAKVAEDASDRDIDFFTPWVDALFVWFVWKDPAVVLAVVVPLAIALQVAVHGLRAEISSGTHVVQPPRVHEQEVARVKVFSRVAIASASLIAVFTTFTVLDGFLGRSGNRDVSMAATVALCGFVTALLCLDAARVATTQDLEQRLKAAKALHQDRKLRLGPLKRDLPSRRFVWLSSGALFVAFVVIPGAVFEFHDRTGSVSVPPAGWLGVAARLGLILGLTGVLAAFLALNFVALLIVTVVPDEYVPRGARVVIFVVLGVLSCLSVAAGLLDWRGGGPLGRYMIGLFPSLALFSMLAAYMQGGRTASAWMTRYNFGFHGLLRYWAVVVLLGLMRRSNDQVSWLQHALHDPALESATGDPAYQPKRSTAYDRLSSFLAGAIRR